MSQHVTITGDERFASLVNVTLIPGLHGVGLVDGRKVSIVAHEESVHAVDADKVELWSTYTGHPASGLRYQRSDKGGFRIVRVGHGTGRLTVLARIADASEGDPDETELYRNYGLRVNTAIEALSEGN